MYTLYAPGSRQRLERLMAKPSTDETQQQVKKIYLAHTDYLAAEQSAVFQICCSISLFPGRRTICCFPNLL